ncbi:MAG: SAM-dependent methyltransferase [Candidatus Omnitrophota bacterium]
MSNKLYLIPNTITDEARADTIPSCIAEVVSQVRLFFVEEPKSARALLRKLRGDFPLTECTFVPLNEHTSINDIKGYIHEAKDKDAAIISEAGYPCVADPGANLVRLAHEQGREVVPLIGASSIILALAASGLGGQNFAFIGYLPKDKTERYKRIRMLEQRSAQESQTQIIMETPYRNSSLLEDLLSTCHPKTLLCVAADITGPTQMIKTATIDEWKKRPILLDKKPTLFLLLYFY